MPSFKINMQNNIFNQYASYYDILNQDKDYTKESLFVAELIKLFALKKNAIKLLDLACGTGRHTEELARMGYITDGSDISHDMINIAKKRVEKSGLSIHFYNESFQTSHCIPEKYDVIIAMYSAIDYLITDSDLESSLKNIRGLLNKGGIFICDFWNAYVVPNNFSPVKVKEAVKDSHTILRTSRTTLDTIKKIAEVNFEFILSKSNKIIHEFSEKHFVRYFFPEEMFHILETNGFKVVHRCPFLQKDVSILNIDWNLTYVATT